MNGGFTINQDYKGIFTAYAVSSASESRAGTEDELEPDLPVTDVGGTARR